MNQGVSARRNGDNKHFWLLQLSESRNFAHQRYEMKKIAIFLLSSATLFACSSRSHADIDTSVPQVQEGNTAFSTPQPATADSTNTLSEAPAEAYQAANLNPPHGQPGHDCSIAVGAPLNAKTSAPAPAAAPLPTTKLNPPHGQPGHRCEIPVGQPLP